MSDSKYQAALDVLQERHKQAAKYSEAHDDGEAKGQLADAAAAYIMGDRNLYPWSNSEVVAPFGTRERRDQRRAYVIAAALLIAEIERIDRAEAAHAA